VNHTDVVIRFGIDIDIIAAGRAGRPGGTVQQPTSEQKTLQTSRRQVVVMGAAVTLTGGAALSACSSGSATAPAVVLDPTTSPTGSSSPSSSGSASESASVEATSSNARSTSAAAKTTAKTTAAKTTSKTSTAEATTTSATTTSKTTAKPTTKPPAEDFSKGALAKLSDIPIGGSIAAGGTIIARTGSNSVRGHSSVCTHMGCPVPAGGRTLTCPCHGSQFDAASGAVLHGPAARPLPSVGLVVKGGYVHRG
jgi:cytochrome b6-f complex iron-sulfur subunit